MTNGTEAQGDLFARRCAEIQDAWDEIRVAISEVVHTAGVKKVADRLGRDDDLLSNMLSGRRALPPRDLFIIMREFDPANRILFLLCRLLAFQEPEPRREITAEEFRSSAYTVAISHGEAGVAILAEILKEPVDKVREDVRRAHPGKFGKRS